MQHAIYKSLKYAKFNELSKCMLKPDNALFPAYVNAIHLSPPTRQNCCRRVQSFLQESAVFLHGKSFQCALKYVTFASALKIKPKKSILI